MNNAATKTSSTPYKRSYFNIQLAPKKGYVVTSSTDSLPEENSPLVSDWDEPCAMQTPSPCRAAEREEIYVDNQFKVKKSEIEDIDSVKRKLTFGDCAMERESLVGTSSQTEKRNIKGDTVLKLR